jgi:hypothetical protein
MPTGTKHDELFVQLIAMFHAATLQHLGKLKNSLVDSLETDAEQAQISIGMLEMLLEKTKGNIAEADAKTLSDVVDQLKLAFTEIQKKENQPL